MGLDLDFGGEVKASTGFTPIPEGQYKARIEKLEVKETKPKEGEAQTASDGSQARYLNIQYKITEGDYENRVIFGMQSLRFPANQLDDTEKERQTREIFLGWLNTVTGTDFAGSSHSLDLNNLLGSEVTLIVNQREYQGEIQNGVKRVMPSSKTTADTVDAMRRTL